MRIWILEAGPIILGLALVAAVLHEYWPRDWTGKRRSIKIKTGKKDWE